MEMTSGLVGLVKPLKINSEQEVHRQRNYWEALLGTAPVQEGRQSDKIDGGTEKKQ